MTIKEFFSFKTNKYFWVNIIAMIVVMVVMIFGVLKWLDIHTHHGESVVVPDVKGMTVEEATKMFRNHGLVYVISDTKYVKDKAAGIILELKPGAGEKVKEGRTVYLTVNTLDVPLRAIPDVADNSSLRQAQAKLLNAGFKLNQVQLVNGEKDWVYGVKYQGRQLAAGEDEHIDLSDTECKIIAQIGHGYSNKEIAQKLGFSEGTIRNYLSVILDKLDLRDRTQLAIWYLSRGNK